MNRPCLPQSQLWRWFAGCLSVVAIAPPLVGWPLTRTAIAATALEVAQAPTRPTLRMGSTGNAVSEIQAMLVLLGYFAGPVDGRYQAATEAAVKQFQADVDLNDDGIVGPATWAKLLPTPSTELTPPAVATPTPTSAAATPDPPVELPILRQGMSGPAVARVQETLKARGFYTSTVDGIFGPATEAAVMAFQRSVQLAADGVVGPATWQALLQ